METFRYLNPFERASVHEDDVWGEHRQDSFDVETIHADVSRVLLDDLQRVKHAANTRVRFLVGPPGIGKSHLFSRLRRQTGDEAAFAFASNPPTRADATPYWVLDRVVSGLQHKRMIDGALKPYSQLDALIYRCLMQNSALRGATEEATHELIAKWEQAERNRQLRSLREDVFGPDTDDRLIGALFNVLRPECRRLALAWLAGKPLTEEDLHAIGLATTLTETEVRSLLVLFGRLGRLAGLPLVLVLDQLDLMVEAAQIDAFQDLLFELIDKSRNWYVVTALLRPRYEAWFSRFNEPLRTRLQAGTAGTMPTTEMWAVSDPVQKRALLEKRLGSEPLRAARERQGVASPIFPLLPKDIESLVVTGNVESIAPRALLTRAARVYEQRVDGTTRRRALAEVIQSEFETLRAGVVEESLSLDRAAIADRVAEMVRLVALRAGVGDVGVAVGPLEGRGPGGGTHNIFTVGVNTLHVTGHHMQQGAAFPTFASKVLSLEPGAIFVRSAMAKVSGPKSLDLLKRIRERHTFVSLTAPMLADLEAVAQLLAAMRAGDLRTLDTDPNPTDEAVLRAVAGLPVLDSLPIAAAVWDGLRRQEPGQPSTPPQPQPPPPELADQWEPAAIAPILREIMRPLRWLAFERLRWLLRRRHRINLEAHELSRLLNTEPCVNMFEFHPAAALTPGLPQILIFVEDDRAAA
jgi:hypothetical protein